MTKKAPPEKKKPGRKTAPRSPKIATMKASEFMALREAAGFTFQELADWMGTDLRTIQRYEYGERKIYGPVAVLMRLLCAGKSKVMAKANGKAAKKSAQ